MIPKNKEVAAVLNELAKLYELDSDKSSVHRARSYKKAAKSVEDHSTDISKVMFLTELPGVGASISEKISEYLATGKIQLLESMKVNLPPASIEEFTKLPGIGPVGAKQLYNTYKIKNLEELEQAILNNTIKDQKLIEGLQFVKANSERRPLAFAKDVANKIIQDLKTASLKSIEACGSLRRKKETIKDIDLLCVSEDPKKVQERFLQHGKLVVAGDTKSAILIDNFKIELTFVTEQEYASYLLHLTGSAEFNKACRALALHKNMSLSEHGLTKNETLHHYNTEEAFLEALGIPYIPPELRDNPKVISVINKMTEVNW